MNAAVELLARRPFTDIRATQIARLANMPQSNFYSYFGNVEAVILAVAGEVSTDSLTVFLEADWAGEVGVEQAQRLVESALNLWRQHKDILSLVGVLADRRHGAFPALRVRQMRALYKAFEAKVVQAQAAGAIQATVTARLVGYECVGLLTSIGQAHDLLIASGFTQDDLVETTARLLHRMATGLSPGQASLPERTGPNTGTAISPCCSNRTRTGMPISISLGSQSTMLLAIRRSSCSGSCTMAMT